MYLGVVGTEDTEDAEDAEDAEAAEDAPNGSQCGPEWVQTRRAGFRVLGF